MWALVYLALLDHPSYRRASATRTGKQVGRQFHLRFDIVQASPRATCLVSSLSRELLG